MILAHGFRLTGHSIFIEAFHWRRDILLSARELEAVAVSVRTHPGPLLVFGAGYDSAFWTLLNCENPTIVLESERYWMKVINREWQNLRIEQVVYSTRLSELSDAEIDRMEVPSLELPADIRHQKWQTILVDAPQGWGDGPGRSQSIFEASRLAAEGGRIFVHDCDRPAERMLTARFLARFQCVKLTDRLWLFH